MDPGLVRKELRGKHFVGIRTQSVDEGFQLLSHLSFSHSSLSFSYAFSDYAFQVMRSFRNYHTISMDSCLPSHSLVPYL